MSDSSSDNCWNTPSNIADTNWQGLGKAPEAFRRSNCFPKPVTRLCIQCLLDAVLQTWQHKCKQSPLIKIKLKRKLPFNFQLLETCCCSIQLLPSDWWGPARTAASPGRSCCLLLLRAARGTDPVCCVRYPGKKAGVVSQGLSRRPAPSCCSTHPVQFSLPQQQLWAGAATSSPAAANVPSSLAF